MTHIVAAWGERASGPGWANRIINVLEMDEAGKLSIRYIQPEDQTIEMHTLLDISDMLTGQLVTAVKNAKGKS